MTQVVWNRLDEPGIEQCRVTEGAGGVHVAGDVEGAFGTCSYELQATPTWEFVRLVLSSRGATVAVGRTADGWLVDGEPRADLVAAHEVDISVSPLSNTLPIRRLALGIGESADITTAYVDVPALTVTTDPQRYTRLGAREYLYESRDSDFVRTITVDEDGLVIDYPGLFDRAPA